MKRLKITLENETKQDKLKHKYSKYLCLDPNLCAFEDEETIETAQIEHIKKNQVKNTKKIFFANYLYFIYYNNCSDWFFRLCVHTTE